MKWKELHTFPPIWKYIMIVFGLAYFFLLHVAKHIQFSSHKFNFLYMLESRMNINSEPDRFFNHPTSHLGNSDSFLKCTEMWAFLFLINDWKDKFCANLFLGSHWIISLFHKLLYFLHSMIFLFFMEHWSKNKHLCSLLSSL